MTVLYAKFNGEASIQEVARVQGIGAQGKVRLAAHPTKTS